MALPASNKDKTTGRDSRGLAQAIFVAVALAIIFGGLWLLYETSAPYHPEVLGADAETYGSTGG